MFTLPQGYFPGKEFYILYAGRENKCTGSWLSREKKESQANFEAGRYVHLWIFIFTEPGCSDFLAAKLN